MKRPVIVICIVVLSLFSGVFAQDIPPTPVTIPDVVGLALPEAAARLNRVGLNMRVMPEWDASATPDTVLTQTPLADSGFTLGDAVTVTVARPVNAELIYDDNDLTIHNLTDAPLNVFNVTFEGVESQTAFAARRWTANSQLTIRADQCLQVWSIGRNAFKDIPACTFIQLWMTTTNPAEHFWGSRQAAFRVVQDGIVRGECPSATVPEEILTCSLYLAPDEIPADVSEYLYFSYTRDWLLIINTSANRWLPTRQARLESFGVLDDSGGFALTGATGDAGLLAPGQCLLIAAGDVRPDAAVCDVIAQALAPNAFWREGFRVRGMPGAERRRCPVPVDGRETVCLVPR